jgi:hypothetical protein
MSRLCHRRVFTFFFSFSCILSMTVGAQTVQLDTAAQSAGMVGIEPAAMVGLTLSQVMERFGAPDSVFAVRGPEAWQDDVVFRYEGFELYLFRDRVWQARSETAQGLRSGDSRENVIALLGEPLLRLDSSFVYQLGGKTWPLRLRVRFDPGGSVADLYLYRADF